MSLSKATLRNLDLAVQRQMDRDGIPGLALALTDSDGLIHQQTYGYSSLEARTPVRPEHRFEYGSLGKSFTCILLLQLADERRIDLHQPVTAYLPWFEVQTDHEPITPHHLMTHTAGIINGTDFPADARYEVWALRETRAVNPPGEQFHYSNAGYKALGLLLEHVTGHSYASLVQARILDPLGMADTDPAITHATRRHLAAGYRHFYDDRPWRREHGHVPATWLETDTADGCLAGTASDLACYLRMLMNGGAQPDGLLLSEAAFDLMTTPHARLPGARLDPDEIESGGYGYGIYSYVQDDRHHIGHGGGMVGWHTHMLADRTTGIGAVVLINGPGACESLAEYALQLLRANADDQPLPDPPEVRDPMHVENAGDYAGRYRGDDGDLEVVSFADGLRMTCGNSAAELVLRENDVFQVQHPDFELFLLRFERDESGEIVGVAHGGRYWRADGATSSPADYPNAWSGYPGHYRSHNPWLGNFRIVLRAGRLYLVTPSGYEEPVTQRGDGLFRVGDEQSPEFISFDTVVDGEAWRANYSGCDYYRFFTP